MKESTKYQIRRFFGIMSIILAVVLIIPTIVILYLSGGYRETDPVYTGEYPELFSVASSSLLGMGRDLRWDQPLIVVLEEDVHGRVLFEYQEGSLPPSRLIIQSVGDGYAYFYPHYNFMLNTQESIENLKQVNSWNQKMSDTSEFVRVRIVHERETGPAPPEILESARRVLFPNSPPISDISYISYSLIFLRTDNYGRSIYATSSTQFVILFQPDHTFDPETSILEITERNRYQTELRLFMEANGWDTPFISE